MKIQLDDNNYISAYAVVGDIENSIDVDFGSDIFGENPCFLYQYKNGKVVLDKTKKTAYEKEKETAEKKEEINQEIDSIVLWFENYDKKYKEYERCQRFGLEFNEDIKKLNKQAKEQQVLLLNLKKEYETLK